MLEKVSKADWQYITPFFACTICFLATNLFQIDEHSIAYWSGKLTSEPYRIFTSHFFHGNFNHLLSNISGIIVVRFFLKALRLRSDYFFYLFIVLMIPLQTLICWCVDMYIYGNLNSLTIGFSGILFGMDAFILMTTIFGKKRFLFIKCEMIKNSNLVKSISLLTGLGVIWSFFPGISFLGHMSGLIAGFFLFWL